MVVGRPFPKGTSGNPRGRAPGVKNLATELEQLGRQLAKPRTQAELEKMPRSRRLAYVLWDRALSGDMRAAEHISDRLIGRPAQEVRWTQEQPALIFQILDPRVPEQLPAGDVVEGESTELETTTGKALPPPGDVS